MLRFSKKDYNVANIEPCATGPVVSLIIPTHNAGQYFSDLLHTLEIQTIKPVQTIIIDSGSTDGTRNLAKSKNCKIITINRSKFDQGTTRNIAMEKIYSEFAIFLTQDAMPVDEYVIAELIEPMQTNQHIAMCYGRQLPRTDADFLERFTREFNYPPQSLLKTKDNIDTFGLKTFFCSIALVFYLDLFLFFYYLQILSPFF